VTASRTAAGLADVLDEVRRIDIQTRRLVTDVMAGNYLSVFRGSGLEFETVREYEVGDPQRAVDWNVTARMGRPFVKTFVDERELSVLFALDLSASMSGGFGAWSARQTAARVVAALAFAAVRNGDKVGLIAFSDGVDRFVPPRKGVVQALRIVRDALALAPRGPGTDLGAALRFAARGVRRHAVLFVLSDFLSGGWESEIAATARRHDVVAVRLGLPELEHPPRGLVEAEDPESGAAVLVDLASRRVRTAWDARVAGWRARTERALVRAGVDRMDVPIPADRRPEAIARPILRFFRMRELRGAKR
jgi:uncharacterized protein (DUF58 family)